ncbi:MAG: PspC domain-containing protein [Bacteroidota bacterium]
MNKRLYRSQKNKILGGVAAGVADYFDVDPVLIRALFVIATFGWGASIIAYIVLWIIIPVKLEFIDYNQKDSQTTSEINNDYTQEVSHSIARKKNNKRMIAAIILIFLGSVWMLDNFIPGIRFGHIAPLIFIAVGILILMKAPFFHRGQGELK